MTQYSTDSEVKKGIRKALIGVSLMPYPQVYDVFDDFISAQRERDLEAILEMVDISWKEEEGHWETKEENMIVLSHKNGYNCALEDLSSRLKGLLANKQ